MKKPDPVTKSSLCLGSASRREKLSALSQPELFWEQEWFQDD